MELPDLSTFLADSFMEFVMFSLAALIYMLFKGPWATTEIRTTAHRVFKTPARSRGLSALPAEVQADAPASRQRQNSSSSGPEEATLSMLEALPGRGVIELEAAKQLLVAICRCSTIDDEVICKLAELSGRIDPRALEAAASEVSSKLPSFDACRQLYNVAGLAGIAKTERALQLLARGHAQNKTALKAFVQDIVGADSGIQLTRSLAECLSAICSGAEEHELAQLILERVATKATHSCNVLSRQAKAISTCGRELNLHGAVAVFNKLREEGTAPTNLVYNCLLDACVVCSALPNALEYFAEMKATGRVDAVSYNTLMKGYLAKNDAQAVVRLFAEMDVSGVRGVAPNKVTYHSVLAALGQCQDRSAIWRIIAEMQACGVQPDKITCSILLKLVGGPCQVDDLQKVIGLVDACEKPIDEVLFSALVEACIRTGTHSLLREKMDTFTEENGVAKLSAPVYGSMIKAFGQVHDVDQMWKLWGEMEARKVSLTAVTLGCMIEALVQNGKCADAWDLVESLWEDSEKRTLINTVTYSTLMKGFAMAKQPDHVQRLYKTMRDRNLPVNAVAYNTVLNALVRCDMIHKVPEIIAHMTSADPPVQPDIITFSTIVKGYCNSGQLDKSLALVEAMRQSFGLRPDEVMYNSLLDGCAKEQRLEDALKLLDEMRTARVAPSNYTLSIATKILGRSKRLDQAFALVDSVCEEYRFRPNPPTYTCLMQACFNNRQLQRGLALHDKMLQSSDCSPDEKTYCVMVRGCLQAGNVKLAAEVVRCAYHLPGHSMMQTSGKPAGIPEDLLHEVMSRLGTSEVSKALAADLIGTAVQTKPKEDWKTLNGNRNRQQKGGRF